MFQLCGSYHHINWFEQYYKDSDKMIEEKVKQKQTKLSKQKRIVNQFKKMNIQQNFMVDNRQLELRQYEKVKLPLDISTSQYSKIHQTNILGNNRKYYKKKEDQWVDTRIQSLNADLFTNQRVLDIGCHQGFTTLLIAIKYYPYSIHGVDIDFKNIENCKNNLNKAIKKCQNSYKISANQNIKQSVKQLPKYFQEKIEKIENKYTPPNPTISPNKIQNCFPNNIFFANQNVFQVKGEEVYDTILCLKVTKWIHLCYGDDAVYKLMVKIKTLLKKGGILILQAQNWASYRKQKTSNIIHKNIFPYIKNKPENFPDILASLGLYEIDVISNNDLKYPIRLFKRKN